MHSGYKKMFSFMIFPLLLVTAIVFTIYFMGYSGIAVLFSNLATILVISIAMVYIVAIDSKKRWPGVSWQTRLYRVVTMYRD